MSAYDDWMRSVKTVPYPESLYNGQPPSEPQDRAGTSRAAARSVEHSSANARNMVLSAINASLNGATDDEIEQRTGLRHQTASARRRELVLLGEVRDSGERRATRSGRKAVVWVAA